MGTYPLERWLFIICIVCTVGFAVAFIVCKGYETWTRQSTFFNDIWLIVGTVYLFVSGVIPGSLVFILFAISVIGYSEKDMIRAICYPKHDSCETKPVSHNLVRLEYLLLLLITAVLVLS